MAYTTIDDGSAFFQTKLYAGTGSSLSLTNDGNSDLQPDWVWIKNRDSTNWHILQDSSRGSGKSLFSNDSYQETSDSSTRNIQFDSDGITLSGSTSSFNDINDSSHTFVAWQWKCNGGTTSSNSNGSITTTVQANTTAGFSIVTWTGTGSNATIGHGLGVVPQLIISKSRGHAENWAVYHHKSNSAPEDYYLALDDNRANTDSSVVWNDTAPTSSVISIGTQDKINKSGSTHIAYCFNEIKGYSKFGTYEANNSTDGPFVYTGFQPAWVMLKSIDSTGNWFIMDSTRSDINVSNEIIFADLNAAEDTSNAIDFLSNGFKLRNSGSGGLNYQNTYSYIAFAEHPFVSSKGVPVTAR
jgi:hypothetical protein